ncbi:MAG: pseudouridine synthase [Pseudomonadota bacterium]
MRRPAPRSAAQTKTSKPNGVSLARALSKLGIASRTQAVLLIEEGRVAVNGRVTRNPNQRLDMNVDTLTLDGKPLSTQPRRYIALNKPRGLVTTTRDEKGRQTVYACLKDADKQLSPVGRLDMASEGLLLFTNDTRWAQQILDPESHLPKTYHVQIDRLLNQAEVQRLATGIELEPGVITRPAEVTLLRAGEKTCWLEITLHEGLNRQIRRMLETIGAEVLRLIRIRIGPVELGDLAKGETRALSETEVEQINRHYY